MKKEIICIVCPNSCHIAVDYNNQEIKHIEGVQCKKGEDFIKNEIKNPVRTFTGSVNCINGDHQLVSVKTSKPIPKEYIKQIAQKTHELSAEAPLEIGHILIPNILGLDADLVVTKKINKICK